MNINNLSFLFQVMTVSGHTFMPRTLGPDSVVIDLGANRGEFCRNLCHRFHPARCIAVEASPNLARNLAGSPNLTVFHRAICGRDGPISFNVSNHLESSSLFTPESASPHSTAAVEVQGITFATLLRETAITHVDLLKIDIEGAEVPLLLDTPAEILAAVSQITIEFHDFCNITPPSVVAHMIQRLKSLGFIAIQFSRNNTNWLFIRQRTLSSWRTTIAKFATSPLRRTKHRLFT